MKASIEISLYPLAENYKQRITDFILRIREYKQIEVRTNGMSTQLFGDYEELMNMVKTELKDELLRHRCMAVMKIGDGWMKEESLPSHLK